MPEVTRAFDHTLYRPEALAQTAEAYAGLVTVTLNTTDVQTDAAFSADTEDITMLVDAFSNHALFLSIQGYREGGEA